VLIRDEPGVVIGTYYQKQTGRFALGYVLWDRLRLGMTANVIHSKSDRGLTNNDNTGTSYYIVLSGTPSFIDLRPRNGIYPSNPSPLIAAGTNVLQSVEILQNEEDVWRLITGTNAALDVYKTQDSAVTLLSNVGVDSFTQKNNLLSPPELTFEPADGLPGTSINASTTNLNFNFGTAATWALTPKDGKFKNVLSGGLTYESVDLDSVYVTALNLIAGQPNVDSAASVQITETRLRTKESGLYLQEEVSLLEDRLSLLAGILGERSSLNGNPDKYFIYPKVAGVYSIKVPKDTLALARVRAAYGEAGNRPNYGQRFTPLNAVNTIEGSGGIVITGTAGDDNIEPERQREIELGFDIAAKDQFAVAELTVYQRSISNLLLQRALATSTGFTTEFLNGGSLQNRGVEAALQVSPIDGEVDWTTRATLTFNRSEVTELPFDAFDVTTVGFGAGLGAYRIEEGKSATQIVASCAEGTPGCENGRRVLGDGEPDFRVGWSNAVSFGQFTLNTLVDWQQGSKVINLTRLLYDANGISPDVEAAGMRFSTFAVDGDPSPYVEDATFVKLREVSIGYEVPTKIAKQIGPLETLQVSLQGRNLLTFTSYSGLDPEVSNFGNQPIGRNYDVAPYPPSRSFWLSITAGL
jgi:outer membrane receptor protein involved in Fe transport